MSNVLPPSEIRSVKRLFSVHVLLAGALALMLGAILFVCALIPAFVRVHVLTGALGAAEIGAANSDQAVLLKAEGVVRALSPFLNATTSPSDTLAQALSLRPSGVAITSIRYEKGSLMLSGSAREREAIGEYRASLSKEPQFRDVNIPASALVGIEGGRFTLKVFGDF